MGKPRRWGCRGRSSVCVCVSGEMCPLFLSSSCFSRLVLTTGLCFTGKPAICQHRQHMPLLVVLQQRPAPAKPRRRQLLNPLHCVVYPRNLLRLRVAATGPSMVEARRLPRAVMAVPPENSAAAAPAALTPLASQLAAVALECPDPVWALYRACLRVHPSPNPKPKALLLQLSRAKP